jgi:dTDP-glucose 4,6-dehydratase
VPRFVTQALAREPLTIHGDGHASRDWLHVDDTASAIEALIDAPLDRVAGEAVNVATGVDISVTEIARLVLEAVGEPGLGTVHVDERPGQVDRHIGSTDKLERLTGWRASIGFEDGLERTVAWYRDNEAWWRGVLGRVGVSSS